MVHAAIRLPFSGANEQNGACVYTKAISTFVYFGAICCQEFKIYSTFSWPVEARAVLALAESDQIASFEELEQLADRFEEVFNRYGVKIAAGSALKAAFAFLDAIRLQGTKPP